MANITYYTATVADSASGSNTIDLQGLVPAGVFVPDTVTSGSFSFNASMDGEAATYPISDASALLSYTITGGEYVALNPANFVGVRFISLETDTLESGNRDFIISARNFV